MTDKIKTLINNRIVQGLIIALLILAAAVSVCKGCVNAYTFSQDFQWDAAKALVMGINPYDESLNPSGALNEGQLGVFYSRFDEMGAPQKMEANQFPSLLLLLAPMTLFAPDTARVLWIICNLIFTIAIIFLLRQTFMKDMSSFGFWVLSLLMLAGTPYRNQLGVGQHTLFAFAFFMLAVWFAEVKEWPVGTSLALFVSYFKYTLTAPLVIYFIYKKKYREIIVSVMLHIALTLVSAIMLGDSVINMILKPLKVASVLSSEGGIDLGAVFGGASVSFLLAGAIAVLLLLLSIMAPEGCGGLIFLVALLWSLVLTYHRTYDFFVLSAAGLIFVLPDELTEGNNRIKIISYVLFAINIFIGFFVLRIFSENIFSRIIFGIMYYSLTVLVTYILIKQVKGKYSEK